ncbi:MAG: MFS transporter [Hyphomonadaceae bacterium]
MAQTAAPPRAGSLSAAFSLFVIGLTAFLTVVDLFATQAILPTLTTHYGVTPAEMGVAVNSATLGMGIAGILVALFSARIPRRAGIVASLFALSVPTLLLASAPDLSTFTALRIAQGLLMSTAFTLTLAHLGERCSAMTAASAFAAYITGNVASNLVGRLLSAGLADHFGLAANFYVFAGLNALGGVLVFLTISNAPATMRDHAMAMTSSPLAAVKAHLANPSLRAAFGIGFLILFAFIGTFTYVNFVLTRAPLSVSMMSLGLVYFVFAPSIATTPLAGRAVERFGVQRTLWGALTLAIAGLPLLLIGSLPFVFIGMMAVACGTFFAQAAATGFVSRAATQDRGATSGLYLASYFLGGMAGSFVLGQLFDRFGWAACVAGIAAALTFACLLTLALRTKGDAQ